MVSRPATVTLMGINTYSYDSQDRLVESVTWQGIPEEGGEIPVSKETYEYGDAGNASGVVSSTEVYAYEYHTKGYATKKTADVTLVNGNTGSYTATYKFRD